MPFSHLLMLFGALIVAACVRANAVGEGHETTSPAERQETKQVVDQRLVEFSLDAIRQFQQDERCAAAISEFQKFMLTKHRHRPRRIQPFFLARDGKAL